MSNESFHLCPHIQVQKSVICSLKKSFTMTSKLKTSIGSHEFSFKLELSFFKLVENDKSREKFSLIPPHLPTKVMHLFLDILEKKYEIKCIIDLIPTTLVGCCTYFFFEKLIKNEISKISHFLFSKISCQWEVK